MRVIVTAILLCVLLQACGSKGALVLPPEKSSAQQSNSSKQK
ncbi:MAG: LPS translocon maturation chaperone LptM [Giesbergeria sp.]